MVKNPPAMQETQVSFLGWERNGNPPQCSCLENPMDRGAQSVGLQRIGQDRVASTTAATIKYSLEEDTAQ